MTDTPVTVTVQVVDATRVHADGTTGAAGEQLQVTDHQARSSSWHTISDFGVRQRRDL